MRLQSSLDGFEASNSLTPHRNSTIYVHSLSFGRQDWPSALPNSRPSTAPETLSTLPPNMRDGSIISLAAALQHNGDSEAAASLLHSFIDASPQSPNLGIAFETLDEIRPFETARSTSAWPTGRIRRSRTLLDSPPTTLRSRRSTRFNSDAAAETLEAMRTDFCRLTRSRNVPCSG